jgi:hypothetical protein
MLLLKDLQKYIVHMEKYRLGIVKDIKVRTHCQQACSVPDGVTLISKKYPLQAECPIASEPVQYPDGFS